MVGVDVGVGVGEVGGYGGRVGVGEVGGVGLGVGAGVLTGLYKDSVFPSTVAEPETTWMLATLNGRKNRLLVM